MGTLSGKAVLVTGASKGIGAATTEAMAAAGARLIAQYASDRAGAEAATVVAADGQATLLQGDFHDMAAVDRLWHEARDGAGRAIDVLVDNAGISAGAGACGTTLDRRTAA